METSRIMNTSAYFQSMQYSSEPKIQEEEDMFPEPGPEALEEMTDMDRVDFQEGDRMISLIRQTRGKGVYQTVNDDPALAWSVKGQTYPSASRVDRRV